MAKAAVNSAHQEMLPRLLYDVEAVAQILSLSPATVDRLCQVGELRPSVTVGNRMLFSVRDLERFISTDAPIRIDLHAAVEVVSK